MYQTPYTVWMAWCTYSCTLLPSSQSDTNWGPLSIIINRDKDLPPTLFKVLENTLPPISKGKELWDPLWEDHLDLEEELWIYPPHTIWNTPLRVFIEMKTEPPHSTPRKEKVWIWLPYTLFRSHGASTLTKFKEMKIEAIAPHPVDMHQLSGLSSTLFH